MGRRSEIFLGILFFVAAFFTSKRICISLFWRSGTILKSPGKSRRLNTKSIPPWILLWSYLTFSSLHPFSFDFFSFAVLLFHGTRRAAAHHALWLAIIIRQYRIAPLPGASIVFHSPPFKVVIFARLPSSSIALHSLPLCSFIFRRGL